MDGLLKVNYGDFYIFSWKCVKKAHQIQICRILETNVFLNLFCNLQRMVRSFQKALSNFLSHPSLPLFLTFSLSTLIVWKRETLREGEKIRELFESFLCCVRIKLKLKFDRFSIVDMSNFNFNLILTIFRRQPYFSL